MRINAITQPRYCRKYDVLSECFYRRNQGRRDLKKIQLQTSEIPKKSGDILLALLLTADRADCFLLLLGRS